MGRQHSKAGFTLLEILITIAIISILFTILLPLFFNYRARARDAQRLFTLKQVASALQLYRLKNGSFPSSAPCALGGNKKNFCSGCGNQNGFPAALNDLVVQGYLALIPVDPLGTGSCYTYEYYSQPGTVNGAFSCGNSDVGKFGYVIRFETEQTTLKLPLFNIQRSAEGGEYCLVSS